MSFEPQLNEKERRFLTKWRSVRQRKRWWIVRHGLCWGLVVGLSNYFLKIRFDMEDFDTLAFGVQLIIFTLGGMLLARWLFRAQDKRFQQVYPDVHGK